MWKVKAVIGLWLLIMFGLAAFAGYEHGRANRLEREIKELCR